MSDIDEIYAQCLAFQRDFDRACADGIGAEDERVMRDAVHVAALPVVYLALVAARERIAELEARLAEEREWCAKLAESAAITECENLTGFERAFNNGVMMSAAAIRRSR